MSAKRRKLWDEGGDITDVKRISEKLDALYEEKRNAAASAGSPAARKKAIKRAVVEKELDRLMGAA